jgi:hypothetical protein
VKVTIDLEDLKPLLYNGEIARLATGHDAELVLRRGEYKKALVKLEVQP